MFWKLPIASIPLLSNTIFLPLSFRPPSEDIWLVNTFLIHLYLDGIYKQLNSCINLVILWCKARRAARALKGIVMLQAMIRGQIVRNHAITMFRFMQALHHVQTRKEANLSPNIKELQEQANWLVQWMEAKQQKRSSYSLSVSQEFATPFSIKTKSSQVQSNSTRSTPRNSSYSNYMETPNYMAPTESTKAKTRSKSSPRLAPLTPDQKERIVFVKKQLSYTDQDLQ